MAKAIALRAGFLCSCVFLVIMLSANKACNEDYFFATQAIIADPTETPGGTVTATPTEEPDDEFGTATATPTRTPRQTRTPTTAPTLQQLVRNALPAALLTDLEQASQDSNSPALTPTPGPAPMVNRGGADQGAGSENWLGNLYSDDEGGSGSQRFSVPAVVVGEADEYQRTVGTVLKGLGFDIRSATDELELEDNLDPKVVLVVFDASSTELPPCEAAADTLDTLKGQRIGMVLVGGADGMSFNCGGRALGETVSKPVSRLSMMRAAERVLNRQQLLDLAKNGSAE